MTNNGSAGFATAGFTGSSLLLSGALYSLLSLLVVVLVSAGSAQAAITGSCLGHFDLTNRDQIGSIDEEGIISRSDPVPVIVNRAEVRDQPDRTGAVEATVDFGQRVYLRQQSGDFLLISTKQDRRTSQQAPPLGWIHADALLCKTTPLQTAEGVSMKFYVRTVANFSQEEASVVVPTAGPNTEDCAELNNSCQQLTRFSLFYVFAEDSQSGRILLMGQQLSEIDTPLTGWVDEDDGFRWNSRYGLRPNDNLVYNNSSGRLVASEETVVCLHETLQEAADARIDDPCLYPILGGPRWFTTPIRIPILDRVEHNGDPFLRVALPIAGVGENIIDDLNGLDDAIASLRGLRNLDVFFLIDGTDSMDPHIDALVGRGSSLGVIPSIQSAFDTDPRFKNVKVRYGYRIYRDVYTRETFGIGDGLPLDNNCAPSDAELARNRSEVQRGIAATDTQLGDDSADNDHEENLSLGLAFAIDDMRACPSNVKLLFVIGDTGFNSARLETDGVPVTREAQIVQLMREVVDRNAEPIIPFFIQVPRGRTGKKYNDAYDLFSNQARRMIGQIQDAYSVGLAQSTERRINENFFTLDNRSIPAAQAELVSYILDRVAIYGDQRPLNEIIAELRTGESLVEIITALQDKSTGVPALRLAQIERRVCETLGAGCTQRVVSDVAEGYIAENEAIVRDVLLSNQEFAGWRERLKSLRNLSDDNEVEISRMIVNLMLEGVANSVGELPPGDLDMSIPEYLDMRAGLPVSQQTPLLSYSMRDFVAKIEEFDVGFSGQEVELCELYAVARWIQVHNLVFDAIYRDDFPIVKRDTISSDRCPDMRGDVKELVFQTEARFPDPDLMSFDFVRMNAREYWVPEVFLP
ncbi:hypothetical protein [Palleronia caenipelagi]|uniref:Uncharacterized protein n=1 Tax=Palleronia caenipelagi TaxID=2489174 RepID=A0A547PUD8_9RHOB|nr:hypothetical protein [Palleronia caenipelagi]TRD17747.1 hypothetical protein FEV53_12790 [Palleronia caenipelagi]